MRRALACAAFLCLSDSAQAARPFNTDDARTVDEGHCQLETYGKSQRTYAGSEFWFLPACNPWGAELTLGGNRIEGDDNTILQAKFLLKPLPKNGIGFAASVGDFGGRPFLNGISSVSFFDERSVIHANAGWIRDQAVDRGTWGLGLEQLLFAPRVYGIFETYGQRGDKATLHGGLRFWVLPNRFQIDATYGTQQATPSRHFTTVGLRFLF